MEDIIFPPQLSLAQTPTPLQPLRRLQERVGGPLIWLKRDDLTDCALTGNKLRKLEFIAAYALENEYGAIVTCGGIQSNHCRATALVAAKLGLRCHLILRGENPVAPAEGNHLLDELSGATISYHSPKTFFNNLDSLFAEVQSQFEAEKIKALRVPTGGSDGLGIWGYISACKELSEDCAEHNIEPGAVVTAAGSGGTQAGLIVGAELFRLDTPVYGINVCDDEQYFTRKIEEDISDWKQRYPESADNINISSLTVNIIDGYVGRGYAKASSNVMNTIKLLACTEGIILDPVYTGKAFDGLLQELDKGRFANEKDIIFIHTGGIFGLFPYANQLMA